jgi:tRNA threonylcarbamoyladenosine biosynthesis protein TsaE
VKVLSVSTHSAEETRILGASLAPTLLPGDIVSLSGDLGAGKTVFVQGVAAALGVERRVTSPTFTIVHEYDGRYPIIHLDIYRLDSYQEVLDLGFEEFLDPSSVVLIEWGDAIGPLLPRRFLDIEIRQSEENDESTRSVRFRPRGIEWIPKLQTMADTAEALLDAMSPEESKGPRFSVSEEPRPRDHREPEKGP